VPLPVARPLLQHRLHPRRAAAVHRLPDAGGVVEREAHAWRTGSAVHACSSFGWNASEF
jgi:hypothetical protein